MNRATGIDEIEHIRMLREPFYEYHHAKASRFRSRYERVTFEDRRSLFFTPP